MTATFHLDICRTLVDRPTPASALMVRYDRFTEDPMRAVSGQRSGILGLSNDLKEKVDINFQDRRRLLSTTPPSLARLN
jgi:hypothetical protein